MQKYKKKKEEVKLFHLSTYTLNPCEIYILEKGLSFCPENNTNSFKLFLDLHQFTRKLTWQQYFSIHKNKTDLR